MAAKDSMGPGMSMGGGKKGFAEALESAPMEAAETTDDGDELDPEQAALAEQMGMSPSEASALKQFIGTCRKM